MRGRKAKPTALKELEGNPGKRKLNRKEPKPDVAIPSCPNHLNGVAKQEWNRITKELLTLGLIARTDRAALAAYCTAYKDYTRAENKIKVQGEVIISDKGGLYQNPWVGIKNSAIEKMIKIGTEFGLTPSSRVRLQVDGPNDEDEAAAFLFGNQNVKVKTKK